MINWLKKYIAPRHFFLIIPPLIFFGFAIQSANASSVKINAGVLSNIWYSATNIYDNDSIKIFGAVQNHSDKSISLIAKIYIDDLPALKTNFISNPDTIIEVSGPWKAVFGNHTVQLKITGIEDLNKAATNTLTIDSLLSSESNKVNLFVAKNITLNSLKDQTTEVATNILDSINKVANNLADKIEELKKPPSTSEVALSAQVKNSSVKNSEEKSNGEVLGAETKYQSPASVLSAITNSKIGISVYNMLIDFLSAIVKNWEITLFIIIILIILVKFMT